MASRPQVLITGGGGFIGAQLARKLVAAGIRPCLLVNSTSTGPSWRLRDIWASICVHEANLLDSQALEEQIRMHPPGIVYHLAAFTHAARSWPRAAECFRVNVEGTLNLVCSVARFSADCHIVYASTCEVYGRAESPQRAGASELRPLTPYASSKLAGEDICRLYATRGDVFTSIVRIFNVFGPAQAPDRIIPEAIVAALHGRDLSVSSGTQTRDFVYLDDVIKGLLSLNTPVRHESQLVDFASGSPLSIRSVVERIYSAVSRNGRPLFGALSDRSNELWSVFGDPTDLRASLQGPGTPFDEGLMCTLTWYGEHLALWS